MSESITLKTERLLLRPIRLQDVVDVYGYALDEEYGQYFSTQTLESVEKFVADSVMAPWDTGPRFSILLNSDLIGGTGLTINLEHKTAELGYSLARPHWGKGYATEATGRLIRWGFEDLGLDKIFAHADAGNSRSSNVMEKLGMSREGGFRSHSLVKGNRHDVVYYGILLSEWLEQNS